MAELYPGELREIDAYGYIRAARAMLRLSQGKLAKSAGISKATLFNSENGCDCHLSTLRAIKSALENQGIEFFDDGRGGVGVKMKHRAGPQ